MKKSGNDKTLSPIPEVINAISITSLPWKILKHQIYDYLNDLELMCLRNSCKKFHLLIEPLIISNNLVFF